MVAASMSHSSLLPGNGEESVGCIWSCNWLYSSTSFVPERSYKRTHLDSAKPRKHIMGNLIIAFCLQFLIYNGWWARWWSSETLAIPKRERQSCYTVLTHQYINMTLVISPNFHQAHHVQSTSPKLDHDHCLLSTISHNVMNSIALWYRKG